MAERYLVAKEVRDPPRGIPAGGMRAPAAADEALLAQWCEAFQEDAGVDAVMRRPGAEQVANCAGRLFVWCAGEAGSGEPVCMAGFSGNAQTPGAQRISMVYTPPEQRRKGYAGAAVRALTAKLLAEGQPYIGIVTDAANPTSNKVYESVGFEHVCDGQNWWLEAEPG